MIAGHFFALGWRSPTTSPLAQVGGGPPFPHHRGGHFLFFAQIRQRNIRAAAFNFSILSSASALGA
jgi:hypothetical protein